jgi:hypothetical protein
MTETKKHQLDKLSASEILSYLGIRVFNMEEHMRREDSQLTLPKDILGLWEQTVCEIRGEIKAQDNPALTYAKELCDKLEHSMCALAGGPYELKYNIGGLND